MLLKELLDTGFGDEQDYNCAERLFAGANKAYGLGYDDNVILVAGGFGGGMHIGTVCGALSGSLMAVGRLVVTQCAHKTEGIDKLCQELFSDFAKKMGSIECTALKQLHWDDVTHCIKVQKAAAEVLDAFLIRHGIIDPVTGEIIKK